MRGGAASLRLSLLGGFEVWSAGQPLRGFESQKVRALLAYLALHRGRAFPRDRLAAMFWGDRDEEAARRNLRQALYNLKSTLPGDGAARPHLLVDAQSVRFAGDSDAWIDVEAFEQAVGRPAARGATPPSDLAGGVQLYHGDLLAGFQVRDCPEFEEWLLTEQERLREAALEALRQLVAGYLARGDHRLGVQHARRLVAMDPLSEVAHRQLLRLYDLAGQRNRAVAHFAGLRALLRRELGVEPLAETRALHEAILSEALREQGAASPAPAQGPIVPLVERESAYEQLAECWQAVVEGGFRITLVTGEEGIGKTRLARTFLDACSSHRAATVLTASCREEFPQPSGFALAEALRQALDGESEDADDPLAALPAELRGELVRLLPELTVARAVAPPASAGAAGPGELLAEAVAELLRATTRAADGTPRAPVALFLDDLQWADDATLTVVAALPRWLAGARVWLLATGDGAGLDGGHPLRQLLARDGDGVVTEVALERLSPAAIETIAASLTDPVAAAPLGGLLSSSSAGLPLVLVTAINALWDEGELVADANGRWSLRERPAPGKAPALADVDRELVARVRRLPTSARRLAAMAAVIGPRFDSELLARAESEHPAVVEIALRLLLERWLVRQHRGRWNPTGLESTVGLWSRGTRRGRFEFDHPRLRAALYRDLNPLRRQVMHRQVADALAALHSLSPVAIAEELARHYLLAGAHDRAFAHLLRAADNAVAAGDRHGARRCVTAAREALGRLVAAAADDDERARWRSEEPALAARLEALSA
ncbi:MAG TPA: AAA family ATPase [Thermoanaerobaculia bacterium]|jgi:DNA-binding SARP family transcriptional activator